MAIYFSDEAQTRAAHVVNFTSLTYTTRRQLGNDGTNELMFADFGNYNKKEAHEWFMNKGKDFTIICDLANLDPDRVHARYKWCLENKVIVFTEIQCYWIEYKNEYKNYRAANSKEDRRSIKERIDQIRYKLKLKDKKK